MNSNSNAPETDDLAIMDDFSKSNIEQLHKVVLNFSSQSFEIKKLCVTVEIAALTLIATIFKDNYASSSFTMLIKLIGLLVPLFFYLLDICTYYYQDKLRLVMFNEENVIRQRHGIELLKNKRFTKAKCPTWGRIGRAIVNGSNLVYWGLIILAVVICIVL